MMDPFAASLLTGLAGVVDSAIGLVIALGMISSIVRFWSLFVSRRQRLDEVMAVIRLSLARWLALSLELALAADILRSAVAPTWDDLGKLAVTAALRTALNYFLDREIDQGTRREVAQAA